MVLREVKQLLTVLGAGKLPVLHLLTFLIPRLYVPSLEVLTMTRTQGTSFPVVPVDHGLWVLILGSGSSYHLKTF